MKKFICLAICIVMMFSLCACGKEKPDETTVPSDPAGATTEQSGTKDTGSTQPEETSEPESESETETQATDALPASAADVAGIYGAGRCTITVSQLGADSLAVEIMWGSSAFETSTWKMTCKYDPATGEAAYSDCVKTDVTFTSETEETRSVSYEDGTGKFIFKQGSLFWNDAQESVANGVEFVLSDNA